MSKHFRFGRKRIRSIEDVKLNPTGWGDVGIGGAVIIIPLVAVLIAMMTIPRFYYLSPDVIMGLLAAGLIGWVALILAYYGQVKSEGASLIWHDREFGFDERHHPRYEIKCAPQDIRLLYSPEDEMKNRDLFKERIKALAIKEDVRKKIEELFAKDDYNKKYVYYFQHHKTTQQCLGLDLAHNKIFQFHSHICFQDLPYNQQYIHSEGQENWHKGMLFNHPHAEQDGVKVLGWGLDFTTNEPMPICLLNYNSRQYVQKEKESTKGEYEQLEAMATMLAVEHRIIDSYRKESREQEELIESKLHDETSPVDYGHKVAHTDIELFKGIMEEVTRGFWSRLNWLGKVLITIATIAGIVLIVWLVLSWLGYATLPW